ncbi:MAG: aldolase/citrate lyase family protein [Thermodesulfobacteriota bacterium]|nr:aldolase/citrate lyase family protein [Thermodesulfobacteriota bacterium]
MLSDVLRNRLKEGKAIIGCTMQLNAPELVEICGLVGFDFVFVDAEHGPLSEREVQYLVTAADAAGISSLVRVPSNDPRVILRFMDVGASGVVVPDIESRDEVLRVVRAVKYVPDGSRGLSSTRSAWYGQKMSLGDYTKFSNDKSIVICQVESKEGVEHVEEIVSVDLLDGIIIGTTDLSNSLGVAGQRNSPILNEAVKHVIEKARAAGKPYGAVVRPGESPKQYVNEGYQILLGSGNGFFISSAKQFVKEFRSKCDSL